MRLFACALAVLLALAQGATAERVVTDSAGRQVAVPDRIERVFAAGPPASILLYILAPDRMIGWPRAPHPEELPYIAPEYRDLPEVGWLTGRGDGASGDDASRKTCTCGGANSCAASPSAGGPSRDDGRGPSALLPA